jgi:hypothetical protein
VRALETSLYDLRTKKLDLPPPAETNEFPKNELGTFIEVSLEKKLGLRSACFTDTEKNVTELVIAHREEKDNELDIMDENQMDVISNINTGKFLSISQKLSVFPLLFMHFPLFDTCS